MPDPDAVKLQTALQLLATLRQVRFFVTPDAEGVTIPSHLKEEELVMLDFGRRAPIPIEDLKCDRDGISGTLKFGPEYFWCSVPWLAVVGIQKFGPTPAQRAWVPMVLTEGKN
ncbi:hypothetical protein LCGC14_0259330 [marine sediment metagenome]|uniref:Uncharacterized protein n=1 Tax=marine sediment metagenome TaxID=412755 RepID=A0A0F9X7C4_9ZZZZ